MPNEEAFQLEYHRSNSSFGGTTIDHRISALRAVLKGFVRSSFCSENSSSAKIRRPETSREPTKAEICRFEDDVRAKMDEQFGPEKIKEIRERMPNFIGKGRWRRMRREKEQETGQKLEPGPR